MPDCVIPSNVTCSETTSNVSIEIFDATPEVSLYADCGRYHESEVVGTATELCISGNKFSVSDFGSSFRELVKVILENSLDPVSLVGEGFNYKLSLSNICCTDQLTIEVAEIKLGEEGNPDFISETDLPTLSYSDTFGIYKIESAVVSQFGIALFIKVITNETITTWEEYQTWLQNLVLVWKVTGCGESHYSVLATELVISDLFVI